MQLCFLSFTHVKYNRKLHVVVLRCFSKERADMFSAVDCWWLWKELVVYSGGSIKRHISLADVQNDVLSRAHIRFLRWSTASWWCFVIPLPMCQWGAASRRWSCGRVSSWIGTSFLKVFWYCLSKIINITPYLSKLYSLPSWLVCETQCAGELC